MKNIILILAFVLGSTAMAATEKTCYGSSKSDDTKGVVLSISVDAQSITRKLVTGGDQFSEGTYPTYNTQVNGRDGKVYLEYEGDNSDYQEVIMVDQALLNKGTTGLLQFRARGEGFFNAVFVCKDAK